MAIAAAGGVLGADQVVNDIYKGTDALSDAELQKQSSIYAGLRTSKDEREAREASRASRRTPYDRFG